MLKRSSVMADRLRRSQPGVVILIYHRVGRRSRSRVDLPPWLFEEQMSILAAGGETVGLSESLERLAQPSGQRAVVVTFDDGTADFVDVALPILVSYGVPATLYVATDFIDRGRSFPHDGAPASWAALRDALATGLITIGSHTHSHTLLDRVSRPEAAADLQRSIDLIGEHLGVVAEHFAYPKALLAPAEVEGEVKARFRSAAIAGTRPNQYGRTDPYRLARSPIQVEDGLRYFERKVTGGMRMEDQIRELANRRRFAGLTT